MLKGKFGALPLPAWFREQAPTQKIPGVAFSKFCMYCARRFGLKKWVFTRTKNLVSGIVKYRALCSNEDSFAPPSFLSFVYVIQRYY